MCENSVLINSPSLLAPSENIINNCLDAIYKYVYIKNTQNNIHKKTQRRSSKVQFRIFRRYIYMILNKCSDRSIDQPTDGQTGPIIKFHFPWETPEASKPTHEACKKTDIMKKAIKCRSVKSFWKIILVLVVNRIHKAGGKTNIPSGGCPADIQLISEEWVIFFTSAGYPGVRNPGFASRERERWWRCWSRGGVGR